MLIQQIPQMDSPCQLLLIICKPQWDYRKYKNLHASTRVCVFSYGSPMKPNNIMFCVQHTKEIFKTGIHMQVEWTFSTVFPGNFSPSVTFRDTYLPLQGTRLSVVSWRQRGRGLSLKWFPLLQAKDLLDSLLWPPTALTVCLECHSFQTNSLFQSSQFN